MEIMVTELGYIDYTNPIAQNYYGIKEHFALFLKEHNLSLFVNADENKAIVYDIDGNDIEHMTLKQLARRVKV